jgi:hypothetical protein
MNGKTRLYDWIRPAFQELITPEWIVPLEGETLVDYARRVAETLRPIGPLTLGGTSFGGMIAHEAAGALGLESCVLISTVRDPSELPRRTETPRARNDFEAWAIQAIRGWELSPEAARVRTFHLHGDRDQTFPIERVRPDVVIAGGGHVLPATHPDEVIAFLRLAQREAGEDDKENGSPGHDQ